MNRAVREWLAEIGSRGGEIGAPTKVRAARENGSAGRADARRNRPGSNDHTHRTRAGDGTR